MSSQRDREQHIIDRMHAGALALALPSDTVHSKPIGATTCHGCLESEADAGVGDDPWHALCALFWKGRSETLRDQRIPHTQPGAGVTPARSRWVIVVPTERPDTYAALRRRFARTPWVDVVVDRRSGEQRQEAAGAPGVERRTAKRRKAATPGPASTSQPVFRLAHLLDGCEVYESTAPEFRACPECRVMVSVELPRFVEPPVRLELLVRHELTPAERGVARHVVELQSFSPTGRVLLATRLAGRTHPNPSTSDRADR